MRHKLLRAVRLGTIVAALCLSQVVSAQVTPSVPAPPAAAGAQSTDSAMGPATIVVFDGSGSMWGKIEGGRGHKMATAREAIDASLARLQPEVQQSFGLGLVSTGQRGGGSCSDVALLMPLQTDGRSVLAETLDKLNPKGRGPLVDGLRLAARTLGTRRPASILLVHDDADNCQQDACAAANEIARTQPGLRIHVVSMGLKREDLGQVACLATATGGRHFDAMDAASAAAGIETALGSATAGTRAAPRVAAASPIRPAAGPVPGAGPGAGPGAMKRPLAPLTGAPGLVLSAHLSAGTDPLDTAVDWRVTRAGASDGAAIYEATTPEARVDVAPGSYAVTAKAGLVSATRTFVVPASGPVRAAVDLDAGALKLVARAQKDGPPIDRVTYTVRAAPAGATGKGAATGEIRWLGRDPAEALVLAPGAYHVRAERGFAHGERLVTVPAGSAGTADFALGAGLLTLKAAAGERSAPFSTALFVVSEDDPEAPSGRREVARSAAPLPDFVLPAGTYHVLVRIGPAEVREQVAVGAGESVSRTILVGMGRLEITAALEVPRSGTSARDAVSFQVIALDGGAREVGRFSTVPQTIELPAGRYRIDAQIGGQNVKATQVVALAVGGTARAAFDLKAARATLRLPESIVTSALADVQWEIRDARGSPIWRTGQLEPRVVLAPGSYSAVATLRDRTLSGAFDLKPGEQRTVEVGGP